MERIQAGIKSRMRAGKLLYLEGRGYFDRGRYEVLKRQLLDIARNILSRDAFKAAASGDEIRFRLDPTLDEAPFERMIGELCTEGKLVRTDAGYRIPNFVVKLSSRRGKLLEMLLEFAKKRRYESFSAGTFWKLHGEVFEHREIEKVLDHLHAQKKLVRLNDDRFLTAEAMQEIKEKVTELILRKGSLTLQDSKEILGYGRTRGIPVLDYLDTSGLTCRIGDKRVLSGVGTHVRSERLCR
jgi:selenocysteine-specific elongation factor